jgi:hypothetical protein
MLIRNAAVSLAAGRLQVAARSGVMIASVEHPFGYRHGGCDGGQVAMRAGHARHTLVYL